jgi:hypothetical protein
MSKLCHALSRLQFGQLTPVTLTQQDPDEPSLKQKRYSNKRDLPGVPFPRRWFLK